MKKYKLSFLPSLVFIVSLLSFSSVLFLKTTPVLGAVSSQQCTVSGGEVAYVGSELSCTCPDGFTLGANGCLASSGGSSTNPDFKENSSVIGQQEDDPKNKCNPGENEALNRSNCGIINLLVIGINVLSAVAGMAIVFSMMFAGYLYMTARDNAGQVQKAKLRIVWSITALGLFIFMYTILNFLVPGGVI